MNSAILECQNGLLQTASQKGYLTFDDIMDAADLFSLSVSDVDRLSEAIQLRGILVYENEPTQHKQPDELGDEDYSRVDYDAIFDEVVAIDSELEPLISQIRKLPTPQHGEISTLMKQIVEGNVFARERIITIHLRLVIKIALSMAQEYELNLSDCISVGFVGLIIATDRFDPSGFSAFQSYASLWIQQHIQRECVPVWTKVYYPVHYRDKLISVIRFLKNRYDKYIPRHLSDQDISDIERELSFSDEEIQEYFRAYYAQAHDSVELDANPESEYDGVPYANDQDSTDIMFDIATESILRESVQKVISRLKEREQYILAMRYGLNDSDVHTLEEVGNLLGVTRERVRQIETKAIRKLQHPSYGKKLKDFWE